jgi:hypothetical protein
MTRRRPLLWCLPAGTLLLAATLTGCSEDDPAICSSVDALRSSIGDVKDVSVDQDSLATLQDDFTQVQTDLKQVKSDAADEYATEIAAVEQAASSVSSSLDAAVATPSPETLLAVGTAVQALGAALTSLDNAVESTC